MNNKSSQTVRTPQAKDLSSATTIATSKVEVLAKLYLESEPAEISEATIAELCDWLWTEFQSTYIFLRHAPISKIVFP
ncbi:hypothetical protein [Phormidesmis priestleyi]